MFSCQLFHSGFAALAVNSFDQGLRSYHQQSWLRFLGQPAACECYQDDLYVHCTDMFKLDSIKGYFASSNSTYTDIWNLGPRTQQLVCYAPGTQSSTWDITSNGAFIRGQKPASTTRVINLSNYTMTFETMIQYGGTGWRVDTEIDAIQATGPICMCVPRSRFVHQD